jgi:uncharacterized protein YuzE
MRGTYDRQADALYVYVAPEGTPVAWTDVLTDHVAIDRDAAGGVVGVEVLDTGTIPDLVGVLAPFGITLREVAVTWIGTGPAL